MISTGFLRKIDLHKLAGVSTMLGVDLTDDGMRIVVLGKRNSVLDKYSMTFAPLGGFTLEFSASDTDEQLSILLKNFLVQRKITARYGVSSIRSNGVKTIQAIIPHEVENWPAWVEEHYEKLLRLPVPLKDLVFDLMPLAESDAGTQVEITFVRKTDVERYESMFRRAGVHLVSLSAGVQDAVNVLLLQSHHREQTVMFCYVDADIAHTAEIRAGRRGGWKQRSLPDGERTPEALMQFAGRNFSADIPLLLTGSLAITPEGQPESVDAPAAPIQPLGLEPAYAHSVGLAIKGLLPEVGGVNFLSSAGRSSVRESIHRSLFHRTVLAAGAMLILLFSLQLGTDIALSHWEEGIDQELGAHAAEFADIAALKHTIEKLRSKVDREKDMGPQGSISRIIHELSEAVPDGVWLFKASWKKEHGDKYVVIVSGFASSGEQLSHCLRQLRGNPHCSGIAILRSGSKTEYDPVVPARSGPGDLVYFEMSCDWQG